MIEVSEDAERYLARRAEEVNCWLDELVPVETAKPEQLHRAMRYSLFAGGKRLRPALLLASGEALGAATSDLAPAACAVEMIHTYSLIHDDLPAMDDDDFRRGRPTCHRVFGEAIAILAGDALLTLAFQVLSEMTASSVEGRLQVIREIAAAAGSVDALIGGQVVDIDSEGKQVDGETVDYIHRSKTGALIRASVISGGILAGAERSQLGRLREFGERIGLAFQIADDVLDVTATSERLGKTAGKDHAARKATYPAIHGLAASNRRAKELVVEARVALAELNADTRTLEALAAFIIARTS